MIISERTYCRKLLVKNKDTDFLDAKKINELGRLLWIDLRGNKYDLEYVCVETGCAKINVNGMVDRVSFFDGNAVEDVNGNQYELDYFVFEGSE